MPERLGPLITLSGPSGSGKSTVIAALLAPADLPLRLSVSATTRPPRPGEQDGVQYYFWTQEQFLVGIQDDAFLEWAQVYDQFYGTLGGEVEPYRRKGMGVILDIDVQGAAQVRQKIPEAVAIFLRTSSLATYEVRLRQRGTEKEEAIVRRMAAARIELAQADQYDYQVINDDLGTAVRDIRAIVERLFQRGNHAG